MPEDEFPSEDAAEDEELDGSESEETTQTEEDEPEEDETTEEEAAADDEPEDLNPSDTSVYGKNGKLLGKYETTQEALIAHKHLLQKHNSRESELAKLREIAASNGYTVSPEGEIIKASPPSTETAATNPATAPEPLQVDIPVFMQPDYVPYSVGEDGYMRDELGCVTMTEAQWKTYREENLTDEYGNVDWQEFFRVKGQVDQEHQQNRVSALAQREEVVSKISSHNKAQVYDREVAEARNKILSDYDFIPNAAEVMKPFFEHAEKVVEGIPPLERYKPGIARQATLLAIADKFDDFTEAVKNAMKSASDLPGKSRGNTGSPNKDKTSNAQRTQTTDGRGQQVQRTVVITDGKTGNARPAPSTRGVITPEIRAMAKDMGLDPQKLADRHNGATGRNGRRG